MIYFIILLAIAARFIPHMPNFAPITALAIFSAVYLPKRQALLIPLGARFISDLFLGFFAWPLMVAVYASHMFGFLLGLWVKKSAEDTSSRWLKIGSAGFVSALLFFLVTNLVVFYQGYYPQNFAGQLLSYTNALPFLRGTLIGDVSYTLGLFGSFAMVRYVAGNYSRFMQTVKEGFSPLI